MLRRQAACAALVLSLTVASAAPAAESAEQVDLTSDKSAAIGAWSGHWTSDIYPVEGDLVVNVSSAKNGELSGDAQSTGGPCDGRFEVTGNYMGSLAQLQLAFPNDGSACGGIKVSMSLRVGRQGEKSVGVGHWAVTAGGNRPGKMFGIIMLSK